MVNENSNLFSFSYQINPFDKKTATAVQSFLLFIKIGRVFFLHYNIGNHH